MAVLDYAGLRRYDGKIKQYTGDLVDTVVEVTDTQPVDLYNKVWVSPSEEEFELAEMSDVDKLKSAVDAVEDVVYYDEPVDLSTASTKKGYINTSTTMWNQNNNALSYFVQIGDNTEKVIFTANAEKRSVVGFLKNDVVVHGESPNYCDGTTVVFITAGTTETFLIPNDCQYICVLDKNSSNTGYTPASMVLIKDHSFIEVDDTLTEQGKAADAKKTGDEITVIKANVSSISGSNKNLWEEDATETFTASKTVTLTKPIPAGTYVLSAVITSDDTDKTVSCFAVNTNALTKDLTRDVRTSAWFRIDVPITSITFLASSNTTYSAGDTATWADIQIEEGQSATSYEPHRLIANDEIARTAINKLEKFVATTGDDSNDGNTPDTPYATLSKAITEHAEVIYIAKGTYTESTIPENSWYRYRSITIIAENNATLILPYGMQFRHCNVNITGLTIDVSGATNTNAYCLLLLNCTGVLKDCVATGAKADAPGGFRFDGSKVTCIRCIAHDNGIDGFNGHRSASPQNYESEVTLIDCIAYNNGDDGASIHESGKMFVRGGEYYSNVQTGLAPHNNVYFEATNVYCHNNGKGIEAINDNAGTGKGQVIGCIMANNTTYGLDVQNYTVSTLGNGYAGNGTAKINAGTGAVITEYTAE